MKTRNLGHIETMRALAALAVASFHFIHYSGESGQLFSNESLKNCAKFGAQGVELFFIISGFIIPFALDQSGYQIRNYFQYLGKRL
ncbi:MAG: acyltransferase family protein, partial [Crocinitomicaceae bacterium]|nr:acyltransferase family protein [Crocinitomicaceae bacterium]